MTPMDLGFTPTCQLLGFNPARSKEILLPACFFATLAGGGSFLMAPMHLGFTPPVRVGFTPRADIAVEGVRVASVSFSINPSLLCTLFFFPENFFSIS